MTGLGSGHFSPVTTHQVWWYAVELTVVARHAAGGCAIRSLWFSICRSLGMSVHGLHRGVALVAIACCFSRSLVRLRLGTPSGRAPVAAPLVVSTCRSSPEHVRL